MKLITFVFTFLIATAAISQETIEQNLGDFNEIKVYDLINVDLIKSEENRAVISGDNKSEVEILNKNGTLKIKMRLGQNFEGNKTTVTLYFKNLDIIDANEGSYITSEDQFKQFNIELKAQEGAVVKLPLEVNELKVKAVTGGSIEVSGSAVHQDISINTGGIFLGKALESEVSYTAIRAGGEVYINASKLVDVKIRAGGDVYIYGNPEKVNENKVFGGRIKRMD